MKIFRNLGLFTFALDKAVPYILIVGIPHIGPYRVECTPWVREPHLQSPTGRSRRRWTPEHKRFLLEADGNVNANWANAKACLPFTFPEICMADLTDS